MRSRCKRRLLTAHFGWQRAGRHNGAQVWRHTPSGQQMIVWVDEPISLKAIYDSLDLPPSNVIFEEAL